MMKSSQIVKFPMLLLFVVVNVYADKVSKSPDRGIDKYRGTLLTIRSVSKPEADAVIVQAAQDWKAGKYQKVRDSLRQYAQQCRAKEFCGLGDLTCEHVYEVLKLVDASIRHEMDSKVVGFILQGLSTRKVPDAIKYFDKALKKNSNVAFAYKKRADLRLYILNAIRVNYFSGLNSKRKSVRAKADADTWRFVRTDSGSVKSVLKDYYFTVKYDPTYIAAYIRNQYVIDRYATGVGYRWIPNMQLLVQKHTKEFSLEVHCGKQNK